MTGEIKAMRLQLGMVGGGDGAYIGGIHRFAARLDDQFELVAGAFDIDAQKGRAFAAGLFIEPARAYGDYREMIAAEVQRIDRIDVVAICVPPTIRISRSRRRSLQPVST
ncbi:Gfo/Idh/MocA family oxidoreductase [Acidocella sp. MX-AZ03]|uniref:Gfo/Idh/MocA family oxidoreductase n=1 Tax=Acidocella sp. MX-AZ03 TaxID=2697363 RepID=UPI00034C0E94|nr:Gfo/Idh/MocA family oxidoreductase [Acidocella sp. MX-AZ03]WBO59447.1 Gfo/Idh/MocA family oxidoreductase [Acidocella sp. MX-AZ03]